MRHAIILLILLPATWGVACNGASPSRPESVPEAKSSEGLPTREEVLAYLDGKTVALPDPSGGKSDKQYTLRRDRIEALDVRGGALGGELTWNSAVHFLWDTGEGRYAVVASVEHRLIQNKRAFFSVTIRRASRQ